MKHKPQLCLFLGEQIAINVDGSGRKPNLDDEMTYGRGFMDRITLSSSKSVKVCFLEYVLKLWGNLRGNCRYVEFLFGSQEPD